VHSFGIIRKRALHEGARGEKNAVRSKSPDHRGPEKRKEKGKDCSSKAPIFTLRRGNPAF